MAGENPAFRGEVPRLKSSPYYGLAQKYLPKGQGSILTFGIKADSRPDASSSIR